MVLTVLIQIHPMTFKLLLKVANHILGVTSTSLFAVYSTIESGGIIQEQGRFWEETVTDLCEGDEETPLNIDKSLMHDIQVILERLVTKADRLIGNFTTNMAENWMLIRCKFDGGKFFNRSQSGSFEHRCYGAELRKNLGRSWGHTTWEKMTGAPANGIFIDTANNLAKIGGKEKAVRKQRKVDDGVRDLVWTILLQHKGHMHVMVILSQMTSLMTFSGRVG